VGIDFNSFWYCYQLNLNGDKITIIVHTLTDENIYCLPDFSDFQVRKKSILFIENQAQPN
jgi:hypothetical protein